MPGSPLLAARLNYQRAAVNGIDMAQSGRGSIGPGPNRAGGPAPAPARTPGIAVRRPRMSLGAPNTKER